MDHLFITIFDVIIWGGLYTFLVSVFAYAAGFNAGKSVGYQRARAVWKTVATAIQNDAR